MSSEYWAARLDELNQENPAPACICAKPITEKGHVVTGVYCKRSEGHDGWCLPWITDKPGETDE